MEKRKYFNSSEIRVLKSNLSRCRDAIDLLHKNCKQKKVNIASSSSCASPHVSDCLYSFFYVQSADFGSLKYSDCVASVTPVPYVS